MNDKIKLTEEEEKTIIEDNKYLNKKFDVSEILAFGNIPELDNDADRFLCVRQVAYFIRKNGLSNHDNLIKYLASISAECMTIFLKQQTLQTLELMFQNPKYKSIRKEMIGIAK